MSLKAYGSMEAYEKANRVPDPIHIPGMRPAHSAAGPIGGNVHVVSSRKGAAAPGKGTTSPEGAQQQQQLPFWERRRQYRKSVIDKLVSRWLPGSKDDSAADSQGSTRRATTTFGKNGKPRANSLLFSRSSTTTTTAK